MVGKNAQLRRNGAPNPIFCVDIELNVKGIQTLYDSFRDYVAVKMLDGESKHQTGSFGMQDARSGIIFQSFPPVLHLKLKRYDYDMQRGAMFKVHVTYILDKSLVPMILTPPRSSMIASNSLSK